MKAVIEPTVRGMADDGNRFSGFLYAGLMIGSDGSAKVLEYNVRFGDPETQPIMMRLQSDLISLCEAAIDGKLQNVSAQWSEDTAVGVVIAAGGYPEAYSSGDTINGLDTAAANLHADTGVKVFHAGTAMKNDHTVTSGGRVLCATALGKTAKEAQVKAYEAVAGISFDNMYFRKDIAHRAL